MSKMTKKKEKRSWLVTIVAGLFAAISLFILCISFPLKNLGDVLLFVCWLGFFVMSAITAIGGRKGTLRDLFSTYMYWS